MRFTNAKRRQPPAVIIISLIDVMIVMLIFLMVTTSFNEHPAIKLKLPESQDAQSGSTDNQLVITIPKELTQYFFGPVPVSSPQLREKLFEAVKKNPKVSISVRADKDAVVQRLYDVIGAAKAAGITPALSLITEPSKTP